MSLETLIPGMSSDVVQETMYNSAATPALRAKLITQNSDVKNDAVARKFAELNYRELKAFQAAGTQPEKGTQFDGHWDRLDKIVKNNPKVAEDMVRQFKSQPGNYAAAMDDLAANFEANPQFAETMLKRLEKNPDMAGAAFSDYRAHYNKRNVQGYIEQTMKGTAGPAGPAPSPAPATPSREAPDAAAVVAGVTGGETTKPQAKAPKAGKPARNAQLDRSKQLADRDAATPTARAAAPVAAVTEQPDDKTPAKATAVDAATDGMSPEDAKREYQRFGADPKNKDFMAMLKQHQIEEDVEGLIAKNPDRVNGLFSPGTMKKYSSLLKDGKKAEFMAEFSGENKKESLNPADMMSGLGGVIDAAALKEPWLKDLKRSVMSGFGGMMDGIYGIGALQGSGRSLKDMLNEKTNADELRKAGITPVNPYDEKYLLTVARDAQENLRARKTAPDGPNSVALSRHGMKMLAEDFGVDHKGMQSLLDGSATIHHVDIVEQKNKTTGKMEKVAVARLEPFVPQRAAAEPVPSAAAKVEASAAIGKAQATSQAEVSGGATPYPVEDRRPLVVPRDLTQAPAAPRPVPSGETTTS